MSQRTAVITLVAVIVAGIASVAWAAWSVTGTATGTAKAGSVTALQAKAAPQSDLYPGAKATIVVSVTNPNDFAVEVQSFTSGAAVQVDAEHLADGCTASSVVVIDQNALAQRVDAGDTEQFTVPDAVVMKKNAPEACQGASFEITLALAGVTLPD
ncbi:hypothetical protein [Asanoa hainanensis]|uniref:hypothetical protein n=1 Tax=Asanoa hainanensis TaxID=560556 RepID=UPI0015C68E2D|nr:hypothetical protein [Asanoa hainanensis]